MWSLITFELSQAHRLQMGRWHRFYTSQITKAVLNTPTIIDKVPCEADVISVCKDDLSSVNPYFPESFNVAAFVNKSDVLQKLLSLNVNLSKIEKKPYIMEKVLKLDFDKSMKDHIFFLKDYIGEDSIGEFITKNPMIFYEPIDDLIVRINYLLSKQFTCDQIKCIIEKNPFWLMFRRIIGTPSAVFRRARKAVGPGFINTTYYEIVMKLRITAMGLPPIMLSTTRIDRRLGHFQFSYKLSGTEVKYLATKQPKLITYNLEKVKKNNFVIKEEMGFTDMEIKSMLLHKPRLWLIHHLSLTRRFNFIHNVIKISHETLLQCPQLLLCREFRIRQRHLFLEKLGRAQYDPTKENYVPVISLVEGTDTDFCKDYAKCTIDDFNCFLKTL